ncbi:putative carbonic anhydrase-like protein 2 [Teleopsis dalmanni]|uniref:putative carbonic anhydrase-like protein 2 n=1 Tax=Teleopsis dalmanni TaxID=139649 RepID=UPI0018CE2DC6|nr:putative carbonic anhydrase-like protein 2 [Teleopsis dalmanni]
MYEYEEYEYGYLHLNGCLTEHSVLSGHIDQLDAAFDGYGHGFSTPIRHISVRSLLPNTDHYITYEGSTTHPGCWESTVWIIVNKPIYITKQELYQLRRLMQGSETSPKAPLGNNARPLQGLHHRTVRTNIDFKRNKNQNSCPSMYKDMYYRANRWSPDTGLLIR